MQIIELNPHDILVTDHGIREDIGDISGLAATIADQGMLQPLGVVRRPDGQYQLIYGHRRRSAALSLGMTHVPCLVFDDESDRNLIRQLTENLQRRDLNDLEQANAFARLRARFATDHPHADEGTLDDYVAQTVGLSPRSVRRYLGLLDLEEAIQLYLRTGQLTVTQAQHLRRISNTQTRLELARAAVDEGMSAVELSRLASYFAANPSQSLDSAVQLLQSGMSEAVTAPTLPPQADPSTNETDDSYAELGLPAHAPIATGASDGAHYLSDDSVLASSKVRQSRIKSLDQMLDESDRLLRAYADGQLQRWVDHDDNAAVKVGILIASTQRLLAGLTELARNEHWPIPLGDEEA